MFNICDQILDNGSKSHMNFGLFKNILYNADVFREYFFNVLDNFSFEVLTKIIWKA